MRLNNKKLSKSMVFSGGEVHVSIPDLGECDKIEVETKLTSSDKIMELILTKDALDFYYPRSSKHLKILYLPYARQDRRCCHGESDSGMQFVSMLNTMRFDSVTCADIHSSTTKSAINSRLNEITSLDILSDYNGMDMYDAVVSPDAGAAEKVRSISDHLNFYFIQAEKYRDPETGHLSNTNIVSNTDIIGGKRLLIIDDICDGGGTFILLVKELLKHKPLSISLYVTHGIFSKGLQVLYDAGIERIITTNSFCELLPNERLIIIEE